MSATFKELSRVKASPTTDIVISSVTEGSEVKGFNINNFVTTERYTSFTKGVFIPVGVLEEFGDAVKIALSQ